MADTRTLKLALLADVQKFLSGMNEAETGAKTLNSKIGDYSKKMAKSFAIAGAAAGAFAIKLGVDAVKAALEDEASQAILAKTLKNTTDATNDQIKATESYITATQLRYGVADVKLRDSLGILLRATKDTTEAQKINNLAIDIAAATGKDLENVSLTLAKAYDGNFTSLRKLGIPLDETILKSKDFDAVQRELNKVVGGAAAAAAETYAGKLQITKIRLDELKESMGMAILPTLGVFLDNLNMMAKAIGGEDPQGLTQRARELAGVYDGQGSGAYNLGLALTNVADSFTAMFTAINENEPGSTSALQNFADALNTVAGAINGIKAAYDAAKEALAFLGPVNDFAYSVLGPTAILKRLTPPNARASGGPVMANQPVRVGEFGPEIFYPGGSSGSIRSGAGGGQTIINLNGIIDAESARRSIEKLLQDSARRTGPINLVGANL